MNSLKEKLIPQTKQPIPPKKTETDEMKYGSVFCVIM